MLSFLAVPAHRSKVRATPHANHRAGRRLIGMLLLVGMNAWILPNAPAWAWGRLGHRASARVAESRLSPTARAAIRELLEPGESLADASTWADEVRRDRPDTAPWHYINVSIDEERYDGRPGGPETGCLVGKIHELRRELADTSLPRETRRDALRFLIHLVQDVHQPLHVGDRGDRGGNDLQVRWLDTGSNLHHVWDTRLVGIIAPDERVLARVLQAELAGGDTRAWESSSVEEWTDESLAVARRVYLNPLSGSPLSPGSRLTEPYLVVAVPIARARLAQSAVRLASVLNGVFADVPSNMRRNEVDGSK